MTFCPSLFGHLEYRIDGHDPRPSARRLAALHLAEYEQPRRGRVRRRR